tara:strand:- start:10 stop:228 length:219 start_codon:yes stop_codon:yes gene_type:complete
MGRVTFLKLKTGESFLAFGQPPYGVENSEEVREIDLSVYGPRSALVIFQEDGGIYRVPSENIAYWKEAPDGE